MDFQNSSLHRNQFVSDIARVELNSQNLICLTSVLDFNSDYGTKD